MMMSSTQQIMFNRLRWQCRRGMLELDLILLRFLDQHFLTLDAQQLATFEQLLTESDTTLLQWLIYNEPPDKPEFGELVVKIKTGKWSSEVSY